VKQWSADLLGGRQLGEGVLDFSNQRPTVRGTGSLTGIRVEDIYGELEPVGSGSLDIEYQLTMSGQTIDELASSASGSGQFIWRNGEIRSLHSEGEEPTGLNFTAWNGRFTVENRRIALENTRMTSASGVHEVSGQVSFNRE